MVILFIIYLYSDTSTIIDILVAFRFQLSQCKNIRVLTQNLSLMLEIGRTSKFLELFPSQIVGIHHQFSTSQYWLYWMIHLRIPDIYNLLIKMRTMIPHLLADDAFMLISLTQDQVYKQLTHFLILQGNALLIMKKYN